MGASHRSQPLIMEDLLLEEIYAPDQVGWCRMLTGIVLNNSQYSVLVTCIFLNKTPAARAENHLHAFLNRYPTPESLRGADPEHIRDTYFTALGLFRRAWCLVQIAEQLISDPPRPGKKRRKAGEKAGYASEVAHLKGIGNYGSDAWRLFCKESFYAEHGITIKDEWKRVKPNDKALQAYVERKRRGELPNRDVDDITSTLNKIKLSHPNSTAKKGVWIGSANQAMFVPQRFLDTARRFETTANKGELKLQVEEL